MIIDLLRWHKTAEGTYFALPIVDEIPVDVTVLSVFASMERNAIGMVLAHPSWDIVQEGMVPPEATKLYFTEARVMKKGTTK